MPALTATRVLVDRFIDMVRNARGGELVTWLDAAQGGMIASFARGLQNDCAAVSAALRELWSNRQTVGQINRLKTLNRQIYGRANIDLLKARLVAAP